MESHDWASPSAFLTSLPRLANCFTVGGLELGESRWGSFGSTRSVWDEEESSRERARLKVELEDGMIRAMESGIIVRCVIILVRRGTDVDRCYKKAFNPKRTDRPD